MLTDHQTNHVTGRFSFVFHSLLVQLLDALNL